MKFKLRNKEDFSFLNKITLYYHSQIAGEKSQLLHIFSIVRNFLGMLDQVCCEIGRNLKKKNSKVVEKELGKSLNFFRFLSP